MIYIYIYIYILYKYMKYNEKKILNNINQNKQTNEKQQIHKERKLIMN